MCTFQSVKKTLKKINPLIRNYVIGLIVTQGRKNCAAMARAMRIPEKYLSSFLECFSFTIDDIKKTLIELGKYHAAEKSLKAYPCDPTHILKPYAKCIENLCYDRAGTTKRTERCLVPIYAAVVDKFATIPQAMKFWMQEKLTGRRHYKSKVKLTIELITEAIRNKVQFDFVPLDGGFSAPEMFDFFDVQKVSFVMKAARNRCITTPDGVRAQLKNHPALKLHRNERAKVVKAKFNDGRTYIFVAYKRKDKDGFCETVYLISNMDKTAKELIEAYDMRWPLEKVIRTTKQKFGAMQCQALAKEKQEAHLLAGFLAYAILEITNIDKESQSVDELVNEIRQYYFDDLIRLIENPFKKAVATGKHSAAKPIQNHVYKKSIKHDSVAHFNA
jgi:hypothetical protein